MTILKVFLPAALILSLSSVAYAQCSFSLSTDKIALSRRTQSGTITVTTGSACEWTAAAVFRVGDQHWIALQDESGAAFDTATGPAIIRWGVSMNLGSGTRTAPIEIREGGSVVASLTVIQRGYRGVMINGGPSVNDNVLILRTATGYRFRAFSTEGGCSHCAGPRYNLWGFHSGGLGDTADPAPGYEFGGVAHYERFATEPFPWNDFYRRNPSTGENLIAHYYQCIRSPCYSITRLAPLPDPAYTMVTVANLRGPNYYERDIVWRNSATGAVALWSDAGQISGSSNPVIVDLPRLAAPYVLAGVYDFNSDGRDDILWRNASTGANAVWLMNGTTFVGVVDLPGIANTAYYVGAVDDFDFDGQPDIVWRNSVTGATAVWKMRGVEVVSITDVIADADPTITIIGPR